MTTPEIWEALKARFTSVVLFQNTYIVNGWEQLSFFCEATNSTSTVTTAVYRGMAYERDEAIRLCAERAGVL